MRRIFDFVCSAGHTSEQLADDSCRESICRECGEVATRITSAPRINLEGWSGAFPGAYDKWARVRAEKLQQERKQKASHGE